MLIRPESIFGEERGGHSFTLMSSCWWDRILSWDDYVSSVTWFFDSLYMLLILILY